MLPSLSTLTHCSVRRAPTAPATADRAGFTLVELLVVIGIIALLISMLMPALQRTRYEAKVTQCASNLHQWGIALTNYAGENKGYFPRFDDGGDTNGWDVNTKWYDLFTTSYAMPHQIFFCPFFREDITDEKTGSWNIGAGFYRFGYAVWIPRATSGTSMIPPCSTPADDFNVGPSRMSDSPTVPTMTDYVVYQGAQNIDLSQNTSGTYEFSQHFRLGLRLDSVNNLYSDGHVERVAGSSVRSRYLGWNGYWNCY